MVASRILFGRKRDPRLDARNRPWAVCVNLNLERGRNSTHKNARGLRRAQLPLELEGYYAAIESATRLLRDLEERANATRAAESGGGLSAAHYGFHGARAGAATAAAFSFKSAAPAAAPAGGAVRDLVIGRGLRGATTKKESGRLRARVGGPYIGTPLFFCSLAGIRRLAKEIPLKNLAVFAASLRVHAPDAHLALFVDAASLSETLAALALEHSRGVESSVGFWGSVKTRRVSDSDRR